MTEDDRADDATIVAGRRFARTAPDGTIDGEHERGIYADDLRLLRRVEAFRDDGDDSLAGSVAIGADGCAVRFELPAVEPGSAVLLVVELDGTDLFAIRGMLLDADDPDGRGASIGPGATRPQARVRLEAAADGATLVERDGIALADVPSPADGTPRTGSWRWSVPSEAAGPVDVAVELRAAWALSGTDGPPATRPHRQLDQERRGAMAGWLHGRPVLAGDEQLSQVVRRSLEDLAALRIDTGDGMVLGAGIPWFLTVFGRDSILAAWMALPVDPELAVATLRHLARHQALEDDPTIDAESGKILHEERRGVAGRRWHERYYGSVDSTPLFLMLLAETCRWTGDDSLARELEAAARAAVGWIQARIDEDELGLVAYARRAERGLDVQSWKDSPDSQRDTAGRIAHGRCRPIEAQGYAVAALRGAARLAASAWNDDVVASEWAAAARLLEGRLVDRCLVELPGSQLTGPGDPRRGGYLSQGVDSSGLPLDSLCSNPGHLLWCEALADPSLRARVIEHLTHPALDSGWGIRTMSTLDRGHDPASYHCGSVWPHDTAICIAGIARYDRESAARLGRQLVDAASSAGGRLPELFAGTARDGSAAPERLPSACSPQAWAAAAPLLLVRSLLGLEPDARGEELVATVAEAPSWMRGVHWRGVRALGRRWDVGVGRDGLVEVMHVAG